MSPHKFPSCAPSSPQPHCIKQELIYKFPCHSRLSLLLIGSPDDGMHLVCLLDVPELITRVGVHLTSAPLTSSLPNSPSTTTPKHVTYATHVPSATAKAYERNGAPRHAA